MNQQQRLRRALKDISSVLEAVRERCPRGMRKHEADAIVMRLARAEVQIYETLDEYGVADARRTA